MVAKKKSKKKVVRKKATKKSKAINTPEVYVFGRPSKYDRAYPEKVFLACKKGDVLTVASICVLLEISRETYYDWIAKYKDFSDSIKKGTEFRKHHMEQLGFKGMFMGKQFSAVPWLFLTKNMFPDEYKDRHEVALDPKDIKKIFAFDLKDKPEG